MANESNLPATIDTTAYPALQIEGRDFKEALATIKENLGDHKLGALDLERVSIPAGGGKTWELPTLDGETKTATDWSGIIIAWRDVRVYWSQQFSGGGSPPDCSSDDAATGKGNPGGPCGTCPFAEFGTATRQDGTAGRGQACKQIIQVFVLVPGSWLPTVLSVPPTSIKLVRRYLTRLAAKALPYYGVVTSFGLDSDKSADGFKYSAVVPAVAKVLTGEERARARAFAQQFAPLVHTIELTDADYTVVAEAEPTKAAEPTAEAEPTKAPKAAKTTQQDQA